MISPPVGLIKCFADLPRTLLALASCYFLFFRLRSLFFGVSVSVVAASTAYDLTHSIKDGKKNADWKRKTFSCICFTNFSLFDRAK